MILRGILDRSLGGVVCVRGYARLSDLEQVSKADNTYQRDLIKTQKKRIEQFLQDRKYLFFPEVILSTTLLYDYNAKGAKSGVSPLGDIFTKKGFKSNVNDINISTKVLDYKSVVDSRAESDIKIVSIEIPNDTVLFDRIDGNHRLSAAAEFKDNSYIQNLSTPFCVMLLLDDKKDSKLKKVVFHNINSKSVPLTSEENISVFIDDEENFPDDELKEKFGWEFERARAITKSIPFDFLEAIDTVLIKNGAKYRKSFIISSLQYLHDAKVIKSTVSALRYKKALKKVDQAYESSDLLQANRSSGLLISFLYYALKHGDLLLPSFKNWVLSNHIHELNDIEPHGLVAVFNKIIEQGIKVFVAMPYYDDDIVDEYNIVIGQAIQTIKDNNQLLNIELNAIMRRKGQTENIVVDMLARIKNCQIFIADITTANVNVAYELGYARSIEKPTILLREQSDDVKVPFDYAQDVHKKFNKAALQTTMKTQLITDIKEILRKDYGLTIND